MMNRFSPFVFLTILFIGFNLSGQDPADISALYKDLSLNATYNVNPISDKDQVPNVSFNVKAEEKKIDIIIDGKLFTTFCWPDNVYKPILYPVFTSEGTEITRGFPLKPREGEQNDHIHQVGIWFNYGNVNGIDFWGNGYRGIKEPNGGEIRHLRIEKPNGGKGEGSFVSFETWIGPKGKELLSEKTEYHFIGKGSVRIIDRITTLTAADTTIQLKDSKEGMFAIRVARQLELPSKDSVILLDAKGIPSKAGDNRNVGVSGNYRSSEGLTGDAVWGTRAKWMDLFGIIGNEKISVVICDHPKNPEYPTHWHARGYGLFAANPIGRGDFTSGKEKFDYTIPSGKSAVFRYRLIINSGSHLTDSEINGYSDEFKTKY
jgi:hypothetical protein